MTDSEEIGKWDDNHRQAINIPLKTEQRLPDFVKRYLPPDRRNALEVGCGIGIVLNTFVQGGFIMTGIDQSNYAINVICQRFPDLRFHCTRAQDISKIFGKEFDLVYTITVLQHNIYRRKRDILNEVKKVLKDDGLFLMLESCGAGNYRDDDLAYEHPGDPYAISKGAWIKLMGESGYELVDYIPNDRDYVFLWKKSGQDITRVKNNNMVKNGLATYKDMLGISIIGSGNVGRRIGEHLSKHFNVIFYDIDEKVIKELNKLGNISTLDINFALNYSDISFIAVPTPINKNGLYNTSFLENVSKDIGTYLKTENEKYHIFIIKSTVVPGTTEEIIIPTIEKYSKKLVDIDFGIIYNPEFLTVIHNTWTDNKEFCISPSTEGRIVLGEGKDKRIGDMIQKLYEKISPNVLVLRTDYKTAEMTKLVANNRLALAISFSNEIFLTCEELRKYKIEIDTNFVINAISRDPRIGKYGSIFGKGWGGPCFLKDTVALNSYLKNKIGNFPKVISNSIEINDEMKEKFGIRE